MFRKEYIIFILCCIISLRFTQIFGKMRKNLKRRLPTGSADCIDIDDVTDDTILMNLKIRYEMDSIYSYIGESLVSINPYEVMPGQQEFGRRLQKLMTCVSLVCLANFVDYSMFSVHCYYCNCFKKGQHWENTVIFSMWLVSFHIRSMNVICRLLPCRIRIYMVMRKLRNIITVKYTRSHHTSIPQVMPLYKLSGRDRKWQL